MAENGNEKDKAKAKKPGYGVSVPIIDMVIIHEAEKVIESSE